MAACPLRCGVRHAHDAPANRAAESGTSSAGAQKGTLCLGAVDLGARELATLFVLLVDVCYASTAEGLEKVKKALHSPDPRAFQDFQPRSAEIGMSGEDRYRGGLQRLLMRFRGVGSALTPDRPSTWNGLGGKVGRIENEQVGQEEVRSKDAGRCREERRARPEGGPQEVGENASVFEARAEAQVTHLRAAGDSFLAGVCCNGRRIHRSPLHRQVGHVCSPESSTGWSAEVQPPEEDKIHFDEGPRSLCARKDGEEVCRAQPRVPGRVERGASAMRGPGGVWQDAGHCRKLHDLGMWCLSEACRRGRKGKLEGKGAGMLRCASAPCHPTGPRHLTPPRRATPQEVFHCPPPCGLKEGRDPGAARKQLIAGLTDTYFDIAAVRRQQRDRAAAAAVHPKCTDIDSPREEEQPDGSTGVGEVCRRREAFHAPSLYGAVG